MSTQPVVGGNGSAADVVNPAVAVEFAAAEGTRLVPLDKIALSPTNPRKRFDATALGELTESVRKHGVLQPVLLRRGKHGRFELVAGERRFRAAKVAGLGDIPALVRELSDVEVLEIQVIENLQRVDLHPLEEAEGYRQLMAAGKYDAARIAARVGRSVNYVYDRLKLLSLTKEAQDLFSAGRMEAGHAVILARLKPEDQKRAISGDKRDYTYGGLFLIEHPLFAPELEKQMAKDWQYKPVTVRELQGWVDKHVRFDREEIDPMLFPETAEAVAKVREKAEKIIPITHDHYVAPLAKDGTRTWGPQSWRRADKKPCEHSITGVIAVGPGRGEAFKVCVEKKKCEVHWGPEIRAAKKRAKGGAADGKTGEDRYAAQRRRDEVEREKAEAARARWKKAVPEILKAVAAAVSKAPAKASGFLADILLEQVRGYESRHMPNEGLVPRGSSAEDLVRHAAFEVLRRTASDEWRGPHHFPKLAKGLGVDVAKILASVEPAPAAGKAATKKTAKKR